MLSESPIFSSPLRKERVQLFFLIEDAQMLIYDSQQDAPRNVPQPRPGSHRGRCAGAGRTCGPGGGCLFGVDDDLRDLDSLSSGGS